MSATLTWFSSGIGTKTGTTSNTSFADLITLINSKSADANFSWTVASSNSVSTPLYIVLKRKSGVPGRILLVNWTSAPAGNHVTLLDQAPAANSIFISYFPNGNVDTPSNLTASSGVILGDDTGALKLPQGIGAGSYYGASMVPFYFDCQEAVVFGFGNPGSATSYLIAAGYLAVDASDNAYPISMSFATANINTISTGGAMPWSSAVLSAGTASTGGNIRMHYGGVNNKAYFCAYGPIGGWANGVPGLTDIMSDTASSKAWFAPIQLIGQDKGEGFLFKLRQIGYGTGSVNAFATYQTSGPVVQARQFCHVTVGGNGWPWMTNFKI